MSGQSRAILAAVVVVIVVGAALALWLAREREAPAPAGEGAAGTAQTGGGEEGPISWDYSVWGPPRAFTSGIEFAKKTLEAAGDGQFELNIAYGGALAPAKEHLDSIKLGVVDGAQICVGYHPGKVPLAQVLELPFLLTRDTAANGRIIDAVMQHPAVRKELAERWNAKYVMPAMLTPYEFMGNTALRDAGDWQGVRVRISGANATVLEKFGAVATMVTAPETYTALERGTVDLVGFPWTDSFGAFRLYEVSDYATVGVSMSGFACFVAANRDAWANLPQRIRDELSTLREEGIQAQVKAYEEGDRKWLPKFRKNLEIIQFPEEERARMVKEAKPLWDEWAREQEARGRPGREVLEFALEQVDRYG